MHLPEVLVCELSNNVSNYGALHCWPPDFGGISWAYDFGIFPNKQPCTHQKLSYHDIPRVLYRYWMILDDIGVIKPFIYGTPNNQQRRRNSCSKMRLKSATSRSGLIPHLEWKKKTRALYELPLLFGVSPGQSISGRGRIEDRLGIHGRLTAIDGLVDVHPLREDHAR